MCADTIEDIAQHLLDTGVALEKLYVGCAEVGFEVVQIGNDPAFQLSHRQLEPLLLLFGQLQQHLRLTGAEVTSSSFR